MTPSCRVCGTELTGELVNCEQCQTPHHKDCWEYWGRCATYGCRGLEPPEPLRPALRDEPIQLEIRSEPDRARYLPRHALVESHGALLYSRDGAHVLLDEGEVALQLPPDLALELPLPQYASDSGYVFVLMFAVAISVIGALRAAFNPDVVATLLEYGPWPLAAFVWLRMYQRRRARRADRMWLVQETDGHLTVEAQLPGAIGWIDRVRVRLRLVVPGSGGLVLRARGICLRPAFGGGAEKEVVKAYRLLMSCELPDGGVDLIAPVAVPGKGEPRRDFLKELTRVRTLGKQIASLYRVPYLEPST